MTITDLLTIAIVMLFLSAYPAALSEVPQTYSVFLPVIQVSPRQIQLGGYLWGDVTKYARYDYLVPGQWVKWDVAWDEVESVQGVYSWSAISDANSEYYKEHGYKQLINTQHVPVWAKMSPDIECSPPSPEYIDNWINFVDALLERYHPDAIELWNEPDCGLYSGAFWSTCFGLTPEYYSEVVTRAYTTLKSKYPEIVFVVGALTLGNEQDEAWIAEAMASGLQGDALSFHSYAYDNQDYLAKLISQVEYLRSITDMPLWITETVLLSDSDTTLFREHQAEYLTSVYHYAIDARIPVMIWYAQNQVDWKNCNMVNEYQLIRYPVWYEFEQLEGVP